MKRARRRTPSRERETPRKNSPRSSCETRANRPHFSAESRGEDVNLPNVNLLNQVARQCRRTMRNRLNPLWSCEPDVALWPLNDSSSVWNVFTIGKPRIYEAEIFKNSLKQWTVFDSRKSLSVRLKEILDPHLREIIWIAKRFRTELLGEKVLRVFYSGRIREISFLSIAI